MILANNHPSGISEPSHAGKVMRVQIKKGLGIVDMRTLAHFTSEVSPRCPSLNGVILIAGSFGPHFAVIYVEFSVAACSLRFGIPTVCAAYFYCI
ncbi:TPA: JAB domain-containing protein [Klebsiella pneumoniae]|uniref:JAB domain-containing protein n=1 Tax=Klebsiella pneumoniae TaxID=573 RepID=UPI003838DD36